MTLTIRTSTARHASVQEMLTNAGIGQRGGSIATRAINRERRAAGADVLSVYAQSEIKHIEHYIDGIAAERRERRPFSPLQYMRTGKGDIEA